MKARHIPLRTCVVCRETSAKKALLRVVRTPGESPEIRFDPIGKANGRGAYVCATLDCIEKAIKQKRFERTLGVSATSDTLTEDLRRAAEAAQPAGENAL